MTTLQLVNHQGVTYDDSASEDISVYSDAPGSTAGKGIRVSKERWEEEYFTVPYRVASHNKTLDKRFLETGQIVSVREDKKTKKCPYRVERTEYDTYIKIVLMSCHGGAPDIRFISRGEHGYKWRAERNGDSKSGHEISVLGIPDEFLVEELDAQEAYLSGAI